MPADSWSEAAAHAGGYGLILTIQVHVRTAEPASGGNHESDRCDRAHTVLADLCMKLAGGESPS